jgi:hypothetical protein
MKLLSGRGIEIRSGKHMNELCERFFEFLNRSDGKTDMDKIRLKRNFARFMRDHRPDNGTPVTLAAIAAWAADRENGIAATADAYLKTSIYRD